VASIPPVRATAATVVADLHYGKHAVLPEAELAALRDEPVTVGTMPRLAQKCRSR
jgi:hypothetical protein